MRNFIVYRSSAGSGKTYALAVNYISLALSRCPPERDYYRKILAITFTNKAAKEMKERVLHYLYTLSQLKDVDNILSVISKQTNLSNKDIYIYSKEVYTHIIHHYSDLGIQTIDKFTYKIIKTFSSDLGLSSDFDLELESYKIIQPVVALLISKISEDNVELSDVLIDFSLQKIDDGNSNNIQNDLEDFCSHLFKENFDDLLINNSFSISEYVKIKDKLLVNRNNCHKKILALRDHASNYFLKNNLFENHFNRGTFYNLFSKKLLSKKSSDWIPSQTLIKNVDEDNWYKKDLDQASKVNVDFCKNKLKNFFEDLLILLKDYTTLDAVLKKIYPSLIINELVKEIKDYKKEYNIEHISSFNKTINRLVSEQSSSFIFERLGERYNHFLIDEFQDTSLLQWQNLLPLITDSLDFGKSVVVGDGKQSIYRWRSGEVEQFLKLPEIFKGDNLVNVNDWQSKLETHYNVKNLQENFRSKKQIINFNNSFFSKIKQILPTNLKGIYDHHHQNSNYAKAGGYVYIDMFNGKDYKQDILSAIVIEIKRLNEENNFQFKDIAILCNTHQNIIEVAEYLTLSSIPIVSNEGLLISRSEKVKAIVSFVKYLYNIEDNIAKASVITYLYSNDLFDDELHDLNLKIHDNNEFILLLNKINLHVNIDSLLQLSLYEMIVEIINSLKIKRDIYVDFFTDLVLIYSQKNINSLSEFIVWWEQVQDKKSITISEDTNAVKLMTIHKSKGLAFNIVMIPFNWESSAKKEMWVDNNNFNSENLKYSLISQNKNLSFSHYKSQYEIENSLSLLDNINKLYVASTRAKESLYIFSKSLSKTSKTNTSLNFLLSQFCKVFPFSQGDRFEYHENQEINKKIFDKKNIIVRDWREIISLKNSSIDFWDTETNDVKKDWGKLLHYALSKIYYKQQKYDVINSLYDNAKCSNDEKKKLFLEIDALFSDKKVDYFFSNKWEIKTEKEILMPDGKTYIPDRLLINDNEVIIVDYKTGESDNSHNLQILTYSNALSLMGYKNISNYLIYTSAKNKVVKV